MNPPPLKCPKCNAIRTSGAIECHQCGVIYTKAEKAAVKVKANKKETKQKKKRPSLIIMFGGGFILSLLFLGLLGEFLGLEKTPPVGIHTAAPILNTVESLPTTLSLNETPSSIKQRIADSHDCTGSTSQAILLLSLINSYPQKNDYQIICEWPGDIMIVGYNRNKNRLTRMHTWQSGRGGVEIWTGYIMERLESSSNGGSFNNTPEGNIPALMQSF